MDLNYDWDDLEVGNINLDHSENFFAIKHCNHEKLSIDSELDLSQKLANTSINKESCNTDICVQDKESQVLSTNKMKVEPEKEPAEIIVEVETDEEIKMESSENITELEQPFNENIEENIQENIQENIEENIVKEQSSNENNLDVTEINPPKLNLATQWSTQKIVTKCPIIMKGTYGRSCPPAPAAYTYQEKYQRKKEEALRKKLEEEKKMREFHGRPAPNFDIYYKQQENKVPVHAITVPVTPQVLKSSRKTAEKRKKKLDDLLKQQEIPKFKHLSPKVLKEKPFVPKKMSTVIELKPFNLHVEQRLQERKQFNKVIQQSLEEKKKEEEEARKRSEEETIKALRKAATFKARPNPFK